VTWSLLPALVAGAAGALGGAVLPRVVARLPEPQPDPVPAADGSVDGLVPAEDEADYARPVDEPKELYADLARRPGLAWRLAVACGLLGAGLGGRLGWSPALVFLVYLVPVGVALAVIDWRTRYLPSRLILPSYVVVGVLVVVASALGGDWSALLGAALGCAITFAVFFVMWFVAPRAMAFGDVRLSGLLGLSLGWLGWPQLVLGLMTAFFLMSIGGILLSVTKVFHRRHVPFGPFLVGGAYLGAAFPLALLTAYAFVIGGLTDGLVGLLD
jgi:leader peptidase (prepilin peptidase) / N-methyltransferase